MSVVATSTDTLSSASFTQYYKSLEYGKSIVSNHRTSCDSWRLEFYLGQPSTAVFTLTSRSSDDCSFFVKLSVLDENRQSKLELVKKGWKYVGSQETFSFSYQLIEQIKNANWAILAVQLTIIKITTPSIVDEMSSLFKSEAFGDVEIECADGEKFRCHKDMLVAKSHHFATMFSVEMKESVENRVEIKDFNSDVISALLRFVYLGDWGDLSSVADRLYVAADRYELQQLKLAAKAELIVSLKVDSIVPTLRLAHLYKDKPLMAESVDFMAAHKNELSLDDVFDEATKK